MTLYLIVFSKEAVWLMDDVRPLTSAIDVNDEFYAFDGNICFLRTALDIESLTQKLRARLGNGQFFVTEIEQASRAGNMLPAFWDFLKRQDLIDAA